MKRPSDIILIPVVSVLIILLSSFLPQNKITCFAGFEGEPTCGNFKLAPHIGYPAFYWQYSDDASTDDYLSYERTAALTKGKTLRGYEETGFSPLAFLANIFGAFVLAALVNRLWTPRKN